MELRQLRYFLVICEEGSLTAAAGRLFLAQQSLSQVVAALETEFGVRLLDRGAFGVRPTPAGQLLCRQGSRLLRDADELARAVQSLAGVEGGAVAMRYGLDAEHLVSPLVGRLRFDLPHLQLTGWTGADAENLAALRRGEIDLVFGWVMDGRAADLGSVEVAEERCLGALPLLHPLSAGAVLEVAALAGLDLVTFPRAAAPAVWDHIVGHFQAEGRPGPHTVQTATGGQAGMLDEAVERRAATTVGASLVPTLRRSDVRFLPLEPDLRVPLYAAWRPPLTAATAQVVTALSAQGSR